MANQFLQVTTTIGTEEEARDLVLGAVEARLAACGQVVGPIHSTYWWKDGIETAGEWMCLLKTTGRRFDALVPEDRKPELDFLKSRSRKDVHYDTKAVHRSGSLIDISVTLSPMLSREGELIGLQWSDIDRGKDPYCATDPRRYRGGKQCSEESRSGRWPLVVPSPRPAGAPSRSPA